MKWLDGPAGRALALLPGLVSLVVVLLGEPQCAAALLQLGVPLQALAAAP